MRTVLQLFSNIIYPIHRYNPSNIKNYTMSNTRCSELFFVFSPRKIKSVQI